MARRIKLEYNGIVAENAEAPVGQVVWGTNRTLTDPDEILYFKHYIKEISIRSKLIGNINAQGQYLLSNDIKRDLVKMPKEVAEDGPVFYLAMAIYMKKTLNFAIEVDEIGDGKVEACLYLNESVLDYPPVTSLRTFIAKIVLPKDETVREKIYKAFNLVKALQTVKDTDVPTLAVKMQTISDEELMLDEVGDLGAQIYIMRTLKVLEGGGLVGQKIIDEYKKEAEELKLDLKKKGAYRKLQRALDQKIQENGGFDNLPIERKQLLKPIKEYNTAMKKLDQLKSKNSEVDVLGKSGKSPDKDAAPAKKPASKQAGNKGDKKAKKDDKKKDDKKKGGKDKEKDDGKKKSNYSSTGDIVTRAKASSDKKEEKPKETDTALVNDKGVENPDLDNSESIDEDEDDIRDFLLDQADKQDKVDKEIIENSENKDNQSVLPPEQNDDAQIEALVTSKVDIEIEM